MLFVFRFNLLHTITKLISLALSSEIRNCPLSPLMFTVAVDIYTRLHLTLFYPWHTDASLDISPHSTLTYCWFFWFPCDFSPWSCFSSNWMTYSIVRLQFVLPSGTEMSPMLMSTADLARKILVRKGGRLWLRIAVLFYVHEYVYSLLSTI